MTKIVAINEAVSDAFQRAVVIGQSNTEKQGDPVSSILIVGGVLSKKHVVGTTAQDGEELDLVTSQRLYGVVANLVSLGVRFTDNIKIKNCPRLYYGDCSEITPSADLALLNNLNKQRTLYPPITSSGPENSDIAKAAIARVSPHYNWLALVTDRLEKVSVNRDDIPDSYGGPVLSDDLEDLTTRYIFKHHL